MKPDDHDVEHIDMRDLSAEEKALDHSHHTKHVAEENSEEYRKLALVFVGILVVSLILVWARGWSPERFMSDFMAVMLITFATFKFINLEEFAISYSDYDLIAGKIRLWAYAFPFIQAVLGLAYLFFNNPPTLNMIMMLVAGTAAVGVIRSLRQKSDLLCACLGNIIKLPLSKVSLIEDVGMFVMAAVMLFL